jgi:hypothetical protein
MKALPDGWAFFVPMSKCDDFFQRVLIISKQGVY